MYATNTDLFDFLFSGIHYNQLSSVSLLFRKYMSVYTRSLHKVVCLSGNLAHPSPGILWVQKCLSKLISDVEMWLIFRFKV